MGVGLNTLYHRFLSKSSTVCCEFGAGGGPLELSEGTKQDRKLIFSNEFMGYDRRAEAFFLEGKPSTDISSNGAKSFSADVGISSVVDIFLLDGIPIIHAFLFDEVTMTKSFCMGSTSKLSMLSCRD